MDTEQDGLGWTGWFTRPPFAGLWVIVGFLIGAVITGFALRPRAITPPPQAAQATPIVMPVPQAPPPVSEPAPEEETPDVRIRTIPAPAAMAAVPSAAPAAPPSSAPSIPPPLAVPLPEEPDAAASAPPPTPTSEEPAPEPEIEPRASEPPVARERPVPRERPAPVFVPRTDTGRVSIYFDADSSTFDRRGRRMPLRVEVYVDGQKRLETSDPEKREFDLGRLSEGDHSIEVVPYVGGLPSQSRRERVRVWARRRSQIEAVLRREDGRSQISRLRERD